MGDTQGEWDCIVIGAGAAGLSAALVLGRARRRTLVVDEGQQSNLVAPGIGGLLGSDGRPPAQLYADGRAELTAYPNVELRRTAVHTAKPDGTGFLLEMSDGTRERARRVVLATGMQYRPPQITGLDALWGGSAFHCPFCHGWEVRDQPVAVVAQGDRAVHAALMLLGWTDDIVLLPNGPAGIDDAQRAQLNAAGIAVDERVITEFHSEAGQLTEVRFVGGARLARHAVMVTTTLHQRSDLAAQLGVATAPAGPVAVDAVKVDPLQRTSVPGVFAAGDICAGMPQVAAAVASGSMAATAVMQSLLGEDVGLPVPPWPTEEPATQQYWDNHYEQNERVWSGNVNVRLADIVAPLTPGRALDLGCGEGADARWLASRGWSVVAVDVSEVALKRAAEDAGELAGRIEFRQHDIAETFPDGAFDLVSAQFLHTPLPTDRSRLLRRAAEAVAPGGVLVIVDHGAPPPGFEQPEHHHDFPGVDEVLAGLALDDGWEQVRAESVERQGAWPDGRPAVWVDNVMVLRRP